MVMKTISKMKWSLLGLLLMGFGANGQVNPSFYKANQSLQGGALLSPTAAVTFSTLSKGVIQVQQLKQNTSLAKLFLQLDLGNDYVKGSGNWNFNVDVDVTCFVGTVATVNKVLTINQKKPELLQSIDLLGYVGTANTLTVAVNSVSISNGANGPITNVLLQNFINGFLRLTATVNRGYDVDVRLQNGLLSAGPVIQAPLITNRLVTFSWQPAGVDGYPNYEVQVLKLQNVDVAYGLNQNQIAAEVDWTKALRVETQVYTTGITLTMAEGSGYYLWRVRPVGTYYKGGIANSENYGEWSYSLPNSTVTTVFSQNLLSNPLNNAMPYAFYFTDPDASVNWIYSRVFTEGDNANGANPSGLKSSEGMNYANGLLQARQSQKYNSSENTSIVSQTLIDYSGRPALSTLPVPVSGHLNGYKLGFVRNANGDLYTAAHFDADAKVYSPDVVSSGTASAYRYYSSQSNTLGVNNTHVADAEGYPYKRTLFKSDGTNRVTEESGVGFAHALGLQSNGQGRTTRVLYGAPSEDELLRLFGDEAPKAESVVKTITIDPNNVVSVTYTSKEGKTIATALLSDNTNNLEGLKATSAGSLVTNTVNENVYVNGKTVASKRIVIPENGTSVGLSYAISGLPGSGTVCPGGDCDFRMRLYLVDLGKGVKYQSDAVINPTLSVLDNFTVSAGFSLPSSWQLVSLDAGATPSVIVPVGGSTLTLDAGEYLFIKELFSGRDANYAELVVSEASEKTRPVIDAIVAQMQIVNSANSYTAFTAFTNSLTSLIGTYTSQAIYTHAASLPLINLLAIDLVVYPNFVFPNASEFTFSIAQNTLDNSYSDMTLKAGCCPAITVPVPKPPICYLCEGSPSTTITPSANLSIASMVAANASTVNVVVPYGLSDFTANSNWAGLSLAARASAVESLVERELIEPLRQRLTDEGFVPPANHLWKFVPGYTFESLRGMFSNMLVSQYYTGRVVEHNGQWYAAQYNAAAKGYTLSVPVSSLSNLPFNYDCKRLWVAWMAAIQAINAFNPVMQDGNVLKEFNDQNEFGSGQDNSDNDDNWLLDNVLVKRYLNKKMSKELEEFSDGGGGTLTSERQEAIINVVNLFFGDVGRQYAAIVDGGVLPAYIGVAAGGGSVVPKEYTVAAVPVLPASSIYTVLTVGSDSYSVPVLFKSVNMNYSAVVYSCVTTPYVQLYYPYIVKPEWQFKYFVYNVFNEGGFISDGSLELPHQVLTDVRYVYNEPGGYLPAGSVTSSLCARPTPLTYSLGVSTGTFTYTHLNWSAGERADFYDAIKGAPNCFADKGLSVGQALYDATLSPGLPVCASKQDLHVALLNDLNAREAFCVNRKVDIKRALLDELANACYTVVACNSGVGNGLVGVKEVDLMADAVISTMTAQIDYVRMQYSLAVTNTTATVACASPTLFGQSYGTSLCELPACSAEDCDEIVLYKNNTVGVTTSRKLKTVLYRACDEKLLTKLQEGYFLPDIQGYNGCPGKVQKEWTGSNCLGETNCSSGHPYGEKNCVPTKYGVYTKKETITATGNGN